MIIRTTLEHLLLLIKIKIPDIEMSTALFRFSPSMKTLCLVLNISILYFVSPKTVIVRFNKKKFLNTFLHWKKANKQSCTSQQQKKQDKSLSVPVLLKA